MQTWKIFTFPGFGLKLLADSSALSPSRAKALLPLNARTSQLVARYIMWRLWRQRLIICRFIRPVQMFIYGRQRRPYIREERRLIIISRSGGGSSIYILYRRPTPATADNNQPPLHPNNMGEICDFAELSL